MHTLRHLLSMPVCLLSRPWLSPLVDNELRGSWWARVVVNHVKACPPCAALVERLHLTKQAVAESAEAVPPPPPALWNHIQRRLAEAPVRYPARFAPLWLPVGLTVVAVVGITAYLLLQRPAPSVSAEQFRLHYVRAAGSPEFSEFATSNPEDAAAWLGQRVPFACHPLGETAGYTLAGAGSMAASDGRPVGYLVYARGDQVIALYAHDSTGVTAPPWERHSIPQGDLFITSTGGVYLACWESGQVMYLAVGRQPVMRFATDCLELLGAGR